jgi:capsid assembly protease
MKSYLQIRRALSGKLWYVHEQKMQEMIALLELKLAGGSTTPEALEQIRAMNRAAADRARRQAGGSGAIAVIPMYGMIMHRQMTDISGGSVGTSCRSLSAALRQAMDDQRVSQIVFDVDSPGGDVDGVEELAQEIYAARKKKKITAVSNCLCASAAYYLASQASELLASPSSLTGSIGVYTMHEDDSKALDDMGVKMTLIKFGENKGEGNPYEPLADTARAHMQEMVNTFGIAFEKAVARGRGVKQDDVHEKFGQGRLFDAKAAVRLGMADRVATLDDVLGQVSGGSRGSAAARLQEYARMKRQLEIAAAGGTPGGASARRRSSAADVGDPDDDCNCECAPCEGGNCKACACDDCACDGCACDMATIARRQKAHARMKRQLEIAAAQ